jgi:hypothetical protein
MDPRFFRFHRVPGSRFFKSTDPKHSRLQDQISWPGWQAGGGSLFKRSRRTITSDELKLLEWNAGSNEVLFEDAQLGQGSTAGNQVSFRKRDGSWQRNPERRSMPPAFQVHLEEGLNVPPKLIAFQPDTKERILLLDLNPQFKNLKFGKEEPIRWKATDGHEVEGGLYYPVDYVPGKRYPLVIQTHGFRPDRFQIDGPYTSVLQLSHSPARESWSSKPRKQIVPM